MTQAQTKTKVKLTREGRALKAWNDGERPITTDDGWMVLSSNKRDYYTVRELASGTYECSCMDFLYRHQLMCRHILLCRYQVEFDRAVCEMNDAPIDPLDIHLKPGRCVV